MKLWKLIKFVVSLGLIVMIFGIGASIFTFLKEHHEKENPEGQVVLLLELNGIILDGKRFLKDLRKYRETKSVKAVVVHIDSPGGVVGPSQEIYEEIRRTREVHKKPVVVSCSGLAASGAFYAAMAADKIVTNPGTLMGSIGVIMEFANLERLYEWAKIKRYSLKTGAFKDTGAEYREMREDEKLYLNSTLQEVLSQFKQAVATSRGLTIEKVDEVADGRIFTGAKAVELGFADKMGTLSDAIAWAGDLGGLGDKPEVFEVPKSQSIMDILRDEEGVSSQVDALFGKTILEALKGDLVGKPLFLMPGVWGR